MVFLRLLGHMSSCDSFLTGCGPTPDSQTTKNPHTARCLLTQTEEMSGDVAATCCIQEDPQKTAAALSDRKFDHVIPDMV